MAYKKTTWVTGDVITSDKMNNIEEGIASVTGADSPYSKDERDYIGTSMSQKGQNYITLRPDDFSELYANGKVLMASGSDASISVETSNSSWNIYKYELGRAFVLRADHIVKNANAAGCVPIAFRYKGVDYSVDYDRLGGYYIADTVLVSYNAVNEAYAIEEFSFTETVRQEFSDSIICRDHAGEFDSLVVFGDSIFANTISNPDTGALTNNGNGVTKQLADLMGVPLYKHAVNNATLSTKYTTVAQNVVKQIQDYIANPDSGSRPLFIIEGGTNDGYHYGISNLGTYGSSDTTTIYGAIYYAINLLLSIEGVQPWQILVCTPIPKGIRALWDGTTSFSSAGWLANTDLELTTIGHAMYEIALNRQCSVINGYNAIFDELSSRYLCQMMMGDDTHPTVYGSERYARYIYDTLFSGASTKEVEEDIASLKSAITLGNSGEMTISGSLSYGVFANNFPEADPRKFNAVMMTAEKYDRDITITAKTGYNFLAYWYDQNDAYVGKTANWTTSRTISANTPFRLWIRENPLDTSAVLDLNTVKNNIVFNTEQKDEIDRNAADVALDKTNVALNGKGLQQIDADFVWGTMNTSTGAVVVDAGYKYQVVMPTAVQYDRDVTIKCNSGYRYQVWWYSASDEYISRTGSFKTSADEYVVTAGTYFRLFVTLDPPNNRAVVEPSVFTANVFLVTVIGEKVDAIVNQPLSTLPEYVLNTLSYKPVGPLSKGYMLLSCDDGTAGLATYTIPMLINKGVPATFGLLDTSPVITNETYLATVIDAVNNHGCCVAQHGSAQWPTYSEKELTAYFDATKTLFTSKGITDIHGAICPGGASADTNTLVKAMAGGRFGSVFSGGLQDEVKYGSYNAVGARTNLYAMARYSAIGFTAATYQAAIDEAYENHYILCPFWHDYSVVDDTAKQAIIEGMIDYAKTKGLQFITMADLPKIT